MTGMILPSFANVHNNPLPLLVGIPLLLPGILIGFVFDFSDGITIAITMILNAAVWYLVMRRLHLPPFSLRDNPHWDADVKGGLFPH